MIGQCESGITHIIKEKAPFGVLFRHLLDDAGHFQGREREENSPVDCF